MGEDGGARYAYDTAFGGGNDHTGGDPGQSGAVDAGQAAGDSAQSGGGDAGNGSTPGHDAATPSYPGYDAALPDANHARADGAGSYSDPATPTGSLCPEQIDPGCLAELDEGVVGLCDGYDNDCDGEVDEGCGCKQGDVQRCFLGPPGYRYQGACQDGQQTCVMAGEAGGFYGPCEGGITPSAEVCDDLDNNCNGCIDEIDGCVNVGSCPGPGDPRVPDGAPFSSYPLDGTQFYPGGDALGWHWRVTGTPCDKLFAGLTDSPATAENGQLSFTLHDASSAQAALDFTLSGDYTVQLDVDLPGNEQFSCTWIVHVRAPGLRVELCWDATGPTASDQFGGTVDVDLHLGKSGVTPEWFDGTDCDYMSCKRDGTLHDSWGYAPSPIANCTGPGARGSFTDSCPNPRLDIDNISQSTKYVPENINLDNPGDGDRFRVMVHHYTSTTRLTHPLVNVYCGGELRGSYGASPDPLDGFEQGGGRDGGHMWRVVDVVTDVDYYGVTTGCQLTPLSAPSGSGYYLTLDDSSY